MQPQGAVDPEHLSFLFGGSAKPKLATTKVNILKEKEKAMAMKNVIMPAALAAVLALVKSAVKTKASMMNERPPSSIMAKVTRTFVLGIITVTVTIVIIMTTMVTEMQYTANHDSLGLIVSQ